MLSLLVLFWGAKKGAWFTFLFHVSFCCYSDIKYKIVGENIGVENLVKFFRKFLK